MITATKPRHASRLGLFSRTQSARSVVIWLSLYLLLAANWPLWRDLAQIGGAPSTYLVSIGSMALLMFAGTVALLSFTAWSRWMKPVWFAVVLIAAVVQHYMLTYKVVMDPTMMANALQTDMQETRDLLGWRMLLNVVLVAALPAWWLWRIRIAPMRALSQIWRNLVLLALSIALLGAGVLAFSREVAPLMRNHTQLRYKVNPLAPIYSTAMATLRPIFTTHRKLLPLPAGIALGPTYTAQPKPPLMLLFVGETARGDHFSLNGYARDTNPELTRRDVTSWTNAFSCGTNTLASVPCMFSPLPRGTYESRKNDPQNLLDQLQVAGLAVLWIENQDGGCKGVCDRVPHVNAHEGLDAAQKEKFCSGTEECVDGVLLQNLDQRLAALPPERRAKGVVLAMHMMGSHGPAYYKRTPADAKPFMPECTTNVLADCSHSELVNAFDNTIAYTDRVVAGGIDWLKTQSDAYDTSMLYLSDHGESLGELGLFLHGLPYNIAPDVQKHIAMVAWFGDGMRSRLRLDTQCLNKHRDEPLTHDNLFHTILGWMDVKSPDYLRALDPLAACSKYG